MVLHIQAPSSHIKSVAHERHHGDHATKAVQKHLPRLSLRRVYPNNKDDVGKLSNKQAYLFVENKVRLPTARRSICVRFSMTCAPSDLQHALAQMLRLAPSPSAEPSADCHDHLLHHCFRTAQPRGMNIDFVWLQVRGARIVLRVVSLHVHLCRYVWSTFVVGRLAFKASSSRWNWARWSDAPRPHRDRASAWKCLGRASPDSIEAQHLQSSLLELLGWQHGDQKLADRVNDDKHV